VPVKKGVANLADPTISPLRSRCNLFTNTLGTEQPTTMPTMMASFGDRERGLARVAVVNVLLVLPPHFTLSLSDFLKFNLKGLAEADKIILNCNTVVEVGLQTQHFAGGGFELFLFLASRVFFFTLLDLK